MKQDVFPFIGFIILLAVGMGAAQASGYYNLDKPFDDLTAAEKTAAKQAALHQQIRPLVACADPGNMPFSNRNGEGIDDHIAQVLADAMHTPVSFYWMSSLGHNLLERAFGTPAEPLGNCDLLIGIPVGYSGVLMTDPIYRSTYVFAYREDSGIRIRSLDDPVLRKLHVGVYETSALRQALAQHGVKNGVDILAVSRSTDVNPETQQWSQVERMVRGELDVVGVWGPFAGYVKTKRDAPIVLQPANMMAENEQLEFEITIGVRETDVVLKYALDNALSVSAEKIKTILTSFGVPLVECSQCTVTGDLPSHGAYSAGASAYRRYLQPLDEELTHIDESQAAPHGIVTVQDVKKSLAAGADVNAELAHAVLASDPARIRFLAAQGADLDARDSMGATPLTIAAGARDSVTVELLLELGADANALDGSGWAPLMEAVYRDHVPSVDALLRHGASPAMKDSDGLTPLCTALDNRSLLAASTLIEAGASPNTQCGANRLTPLMIVSTHQDAEARGNVPVDGGQFLSDGVSPLDVGKLLVSKGADVNARARGGATALMIAAGYDNAPLVGLLVQAGAEMDVRSDAGKTALDIAEDNGSETAVKTLELMARFSAPQPASAPGKQPPR